MTTTPKVTVVGAGLAGSECAYQLAKRGIDVRLLEQKPARRSPAHQSNEPAELVCSNSMRSDNPESAIGMLHRELRDLDSLILCSADTHRVSTIELADRVVFLDQGRVVAAGPHADLLEAEPGYARIVHAYESGQAA